MVLHRDMSCVQVPDENRWGVTLLAASKNNHIVKQDRPKLEMSFI